ncbi:MAG: hypothetical protein R2793_05955 [Flavobacteriaceae bacterium]
MSKQKEKLEALTFELGLKKIKTLEFYLDFPKEEHSEEIRQKMKGGIETTINIQLENNIVDVSMKVRYFIDDNNKEKTYIILNLFIEFLVSPLKDITMVNKETNTLVFKNEQIYYTLVGITYSTIRGVLYEKLAGSMFNDFILPIRDPKDIFNKIIN